MCTVGWLQNNNSFYSFKSFGQTVRDAEIRCNFVIRKLVLREGFFIVR